MTQPLFSVPNYHGKGTGSLPAHVLAKEMERPYKGYFQGRSGNQWLFTYDSTTKAVSIRGGSCGWRTKMHAVRVNYQAICDARSALDREWADHLFSGGMPVPESLTTVSPFVTVVRRPECWVPVDQSVRVWLDGCIVASGYRPEVLTTEEAVAYIRECTARMEEKAQ